MRWAVLGIVVCIWTRNLASAKASPEGGQEHEYVPYQASVSEVSKDGHIIHNRLTFDCQPADGAAGRPPRTIECVVVQQDLQEPSPPPAKELLDKQVAEMTDGDKLKDLCQRESARRPTDKEDIEFRKRVVKACAADRAAVVAVLTDFFRDQEKLASQRCILLTIVRRETFVYVKKGVWVSQPDPFRACANVAVTGTLRSDAGTPSSWNYTEVTVAKPSKDSLCHATSGTTEFTWRNVYTASQLNCRYIEM